MSTQEKRKLSSAEETASKRKRNETSTDPNVWMKWYEELSEESSAAESDADSGEEDNLFQSDHDTSSEQEGDGYDNQNIETEVEEQEQEPQPSTSKTKIQANKFYVGKDGTKWQKPCPPKNVRTRAKNIIPHLPGPKNAARHVKTEVEIWNLFFDSDILDIIVDSTNIYIESVREKFARDRDARPTDVIEIRAFIGLLFLIGSLRSSRKNLHSFWDNSKGNGLESCYLTMSENRFRFILRCLRFDNIASRATRRETDKLAAIRNIFDLTVKNFQKYFSPSEYLTVDEQLVAFRGRCGFRQYIPSKPAKYGLKVFALVDSKTAYTMNLEVYVGTQPDGPFKLPTTAEELVLRLVEPVSGSNRNITGDNWFTSLKLAERLLLEKKLTYVGTMRKNKREIPQAFLPNKQKEEKSSMFGFRNNNTLVSYCPKKNKSVILLSTMHSSNAIDEETGDAKKPEIVTFYNMTKIGVDLLDQLCQKNDVARSTRRWPMVIFYDLLNITAINAICVFRYHHQTRSINRVTFLQNLAWELIKPQIVRRSQIITLPTDMRNRMALLLGTEVPQQQASEERNLAVQRTGSRGRCYLCGRARDKTTRKMCCQCGKWVCGEHLKEICNRCSN